MIKPLLYLSFFAFAMCFFLGCGSYQQPTREANGTFITHREDTHGIDFKNTITETEQENIILYDYLYNGAGVGVADFNHDGHLDVYFAGNQVNDGYYIGNGDLTFKKDPSAFPKGWGDGWSVGVCVLDINQDGWTDIYVCKSGPSRKQTHPNELWINLEGSFVEQAANYGLDYTGHSTQAAFFDADQDGDVDCYLMTHPREFAYNINLQELQAKYQEGTLQSDQYFRNDKGKFVNKTKEAGFGDFAFGLGLVAADFDGDQWTDIYVSNDFDEPDMLFINQQDGTFKNEIDSKMKHISNFGMGVDAADINRDGYMDLFTADMAFEDHQRSKRNMETMDTQKFETRVKIGWHYQYMHNSLHLNQGNQVFSEIAHLSGVAKSDWSWAPLLSDFDLDGYPDLFVTNGYKRDTKDQDLRKRIQDLSKSGDPVPLQEVLAQFPTTKLANKVYSNNKNLTFTDQADGWGIKEAVHSHGAIAADFDEDGDLDIITNNVDATPSLYENQLNNNNWIAFNLAQIYEPCQMVCRLYSNSKMLEEPVLRTRGYASSIWAPVHFGLGDFGKVDSVDVLFNGEMMRFRDVKMNQVNTLRPIARTKIQKTRPPAPLFQVQSPRGVLPYQHKESVYDDFEREVLLPHRMSREGPAMATGDLNGDGLEDLWIGGSAGNPGAIFIHTKEGVFRGFLPEPFKSDAGYEDVGATFFDADADGDMDLFVSSGSNEFPGESGVSNGYQDRLYINVGAGQLVRAFGKISEENTSGGKVLAHDIDRDGDEDIIVLGRQSGENYLKTSKTLTFINAEKKFELSYSYIQDQFELGMCTDGIFADLNGDGSEELILAREWDHVLILEFSDGIWNPAQLQPRGSGWWQNIQVADVNGDGKQDLIAGNWGLNNKFHPTEDQPLHVFAGDADQDGDWEIILSKEKNNALLPVRGKECSTDQMPDIDERFSSYESFAKASLEDIYTEDFLKNAIHKQVTQMASGVFIQTSDGWEFQELPKSTQIAPIKDLRLDDVNEDGHLDIVYVGNHFPSEVETSRYDASVGGVLLGNGTGEWLVTNTSNSGWYVPGDARTLEKIDHSKGQSFWIVGVNRGLVKTFVLE